MSTSTKKTKLSQKAFMAVGQFLPVNTKSKRELLDELIQDTPELKKIGDAKLKSLGKLTKDMSETKKTQTIRKAITEAYSERKRKAVGAAYNGKSTHGRDGGGRNYQRSNNNLKRDV